MLNVNKGEGVPSLLLFLVFFMSSFGGCLGLNACESIFISAYGISQVPFAFLLSSVSTIIFTIISNSLQSAMPLKKFLRIGFGSMIIILFACLSAVRGIKSTLPTGMLFIMTYTFFFLQKNLLTILTQAVFDSRQFKRLFPVISAGTVLGISVGGFTTGIIAQQIGGTIMLPAVWSISLALSLVFIQIIQAKYSQPVSQESEKSPEPKMNFISSMAGNFNGLKRSRLLFLLAVFALFSSFMIIHFDYLYMNAVKTLSMRTPYNQDPSYVAKTFGVIRGYSTMISFILQFFFTASIIRFLGLTNVLLFYPAVFFASFLLVFFRYTKIHTFAGRFGYYITKEALHFPSFQPLFNALSEKLQTGALPFISTVIGSLGNIFAGLFLIFIVKAGLISPRLSAGISAGFGLLLIITALVIRKAYVQELLANLKEKSPKQLDKFEALQQLGKSGANDYMINLLRGDDEEMLVFALESLKELRTPAADAAVLGLFDRITDAAVIRGTLHYFGTSYDEALINKLKILKLEKADLDLKKTIIIYLKNILSTSAEDKKALIREVLRNFKNDTDPIIQFYTACLLLSHTTGTDRQSEINSINSILGAADSSAGITLLRIAAGTDDNELHGIIISYIKQYIASPLDQKSLRSYLEILASINNQESAEVVLQQIVIAANDNTMRGLLSSVIPGESAKRYNSLMLEKLRSQITDSSEKYRILSAAADLREKTVELQHEIIKSLPPLDSLPYTRFALARLIPEFSMESNEILDAQLDELADAELNRAIDDILTAENFKKSDRLFMNIFTDEMNKQVKERITCVLNIFLFRYRSKSIHIAIQGLQSADKQTRLSAYETIESIVPRKTSELLFLILGGEYEKIIQKHKDTEKITDEHVVMKLLSKDSMWHICLGLYFSKKLKIREVLDYITQMKLKHNLAEALRIEYLHTFGLSDPAAV